MTDSEIGRLVATVFRCIKYTSKSTTGLHDDYRKGGAFMEKKTYEEPILAVVTFESDDVITTSGWFDAED